MAGMAEAMAEQAVTAAVLDSLQKAEEKLDEEIEALDKMGEDDLEAIRNKRIEEMKKKKRVEMEWRGKGHGAYREVADQKAFFDHVKTSSRCIIHFYRSATWRCEIMDKHMGRAAVKHVETKFLKIDAEKSPFVCERLNIWMLPSLVLVKDGKTEHTIVGLDEFGGEDDFSEEVFEAVLVAHGVLLESYC